MMSHPLRGHGYRRHSQAIPHTPPSHKSRLNSSSSFYPPGRDIMEGLFKTPLQIVTKISSLSLQKEIEIVNLQYIGSYNWLDKPSPTIVVPGSPPEWQNRMLPYQVQPDQGMAFKDQNNYRYPSAALLPLIIAVDQKSKLDGKDFDWASVDYITDRNNLRKLLRWIGGNANDFRIDLQLAGQRTIILSRWENRYTERMTGQTFGFNFEKKSTQPVLGCEGSTGHHRVIRYDLDGLNMIVRFEVDACIPSKIHLAPHSAKETPHEGVDNLIEALSAVSLSTVNSDENSTYTDPSPTGLSNITVIPGGRHVPQSAIIELTTRSERNAPLFNWKEAYPQLFISQTPHHFLAVHERGIFKEVIKRKLESKELKDIAAKCFHADLQKLRHVLDVIKELVLKHGQHGRLSLVCQSGKLNVFERVNQESCLPSDILERFNI